MILKLEMDHWEINVYKVYINDDPGLIMAYLRADQIWLSNYVYILFGVTMDKHFPMVYQNLYF